MSSCESCAARPSMRSVKNPASRQRSSPQAKNQWRDDFLAGGQCGIQVRDSDQRDDFIQDFKTKRSQDQEISRPKDLKTKIGDQTMMHRLTREENQPAGRRPAFSTAEAIAMSVTSSRRGVDDSSTFSTITSRYISMLNVVTAQAQADTPRPNTNEPNA